MGHRDIEELRDAAIAEAARRHAAAIRTNILTGNERTLHDLGNALGERLCQKGASEILIRSSVAAGPHTAGNLLLDLIQKCIDDDAEIEAIKEIERAEAFAKADPDKCIPTMRQQRVLDAMHV